MSATLNAPPNFANRTLFHGDNLGFLQGLNSGSVHLIATDPPFNKGRDFHATPDSLADGGSFEDRWAYDKDVHPEWIDALKDFDAQRKRTKRKGEYQQGLGGVWTAIEAADTTWGKDMGAFLCYMGVRLLEMHRVLHKDGSLYLHCDPTASHYLKIMLDAIFGRRNFRNEIVWERTIGRSDARRFASVHDSILYYRKSSGALWNGAWQPLNASQIERDYRYEDERGKYQPTSLTTQGLSGGGYEYEFHGHNGPWRYPEDRMRELEEEGRIWLPRKAGGWPRYKRYLTESRGIAARDVITDIEPAPKRERVSPPYPTQKPLALYDRIIRASSNERDIVLDPFAGCATTVVAAELANRHWIGMDIWDGAHKAVVQRLLMEGMLSPGGVPDAMLADIAIPDQQGPLITFGQLHYSTTPPERTDEGEIAAPAFTIPAQRAIPKWQRLSRAEIVARLEEAQAGSDAKGERGVICGGCGIVLAARYMELDHIRPRAEGGPNDITNRLLLCGPCNNVKRDDLTLNGLRKELKRRGWLVDPARAELAKNAAAECAKRTVVELP